MQRRSLLALATLAALAPLPTLAGGSQTIDYTPGALEAALKDGHTVFVDFAADWCTTCAAQERILSKLRAENPAYDDAMLFFRVDWDDYSGHEVTTSRNIPRRSTLLVLKGDQELGRIVAGTRESEIRALLDTGLAAGS
jgi:thiol-disulfide isomerase/thioredoxin